MTYRTDADNRRFGPVQSLPEMEAEIRQCFQQIVGMKPASADRHATALAAKLFSREI
jgi:hypothetical protein